MAFIETPDCIKVTMSFLSDAGVVAQNVFHTLNALPSSGAEQNFICGIFADFWSEFYGTLTTVNWKLDYIEARDISVEEGTSTILTVGEDATGAGSASADNVSMCITWRTGFAGKSARGRSYLLPPPTSAVLENTITNTHVVNAVAAFNNLKTTLSTTNNDLLVASYQHNGAPRPVALTRVITVAGSTGRVTSQRGRLQ